MNVPCDGLWLWFSAGEMAAISRGWFIPRNSRLVIWRDKGNRVLREVMVGFYEEVLAACRFHCE